MSWKGSTYRGFLRSFSRRRGAGRNWRGLLRGAGRGARSMMRSARPRRYRRGCCCPAFFVLGLAGAGLIGGLFYAGIRFLGWA